MVNSSFLPKNLNILLPVYVSEILLWQTVYVDPFQTQQHFWVNTVCSVLPVPVLRYGFFTSFIFMEDLDSQRLGLTIHCIIWNTVATAGDLAINTILLIPAWGFKIAQQHVGN